MNEEVLPKSTHWQELLHRMQQVGATILGRYLGYLPLISFSKKKWHHLYNSFFLLESWMKNELL
jgi:hypothetical protein